MTDRPADLPDFLVPPVTEVVLGVQFNTIEGFLSPHLGTVRDAFRREFPMIEEHPPLDPMFETFGQNPQILGGVRFQFGPTAEMPRVFFTNEPQNQLLQIQRDRFIHNWRKTGDADTYPRFERMLETFQEGYLKLSYALNSEGLASPVPNQCEVNYINQIICRSTETWSESFARLFKGVDITPKLDELGAPEDSRFLIRYTIHGDDQIPVGRLIVTAEPARRIDGTAIIQLTLSARGRPVTSDIAGVISFLGKGRRLIVRSFAQLTSGEMHETWGRTS